MIPHRGKCNSCLVGTIAATCEGVSCGFVPLCEADEIAVTLLPSLQAARTVATPTARQPHSAFEISFGDRIL